MSKHTPGPWKLSHPSHTFYIQGADGQYILKRDSRETWDKVSSSRIEADCYLIAAAPELLDALREITADYADRFDLDSPSTNPGIKASIAQARAAIAKATGVQS